MNDKELQKIIDTKNGTISVLKDTVKKWVREYNMLDACIELQNEKINAYKMSENEANEIIAELKAENERLKAENKELCERMATVTYRATGGRLSYSNYTLDAIEQAFYDQLDILSDQKIEPYKQTLQQIKKIAEYIMTSDTEKWTLDEPFKQIEKILELTKAEEE